MVLVIYCVTNTPKPSSLKQRAYCQASEYLVSYLSLIQGHLRQQLSCELGLQSSQVLNREESALKFIVVMIGRSQVFAGCRRETSVPRHMDLMGHFTTWQLASLRLQDGGSKKGHHRGSHCFYDEMIFCHFYFILFVRSKSLVLGHTQGKRFTQGSEYQKVDFFDDHLMRYQPQR